MSLFTKLGNEIASPVDAAGNPRRVENGDMQRWMTEVERITQAFQAGGGIIFPDLDTANASLAYNANQMAWVVGDPVPSNNGVYRKTGASGSGSWVRMGDLPFSMIRLDNAGAGTADAIVAVPMLPLPTTPGAVLLTVNILAPNTGNVTINGKPLRTNSGNEISPGGLTAGSIHAFLDLGDHFRLLSDQANAAIVAAAEAYANAALSAVPNAFPATRAALKALDTTTITAAYLTENGREGQFIWRTGDYSAQIASDPLEGVYIKAEDVAATLGAWVRDDFSKGDVVNVLWFGADRTGGTPTQDAFSAAVRVAPAHLNNLTVYDAMPQALNCEVRVPAGVYVLDGHVNGHGKAVVWLVDEGARFDGDCAHFLGGQLNRPSRINTIEPFGSQDNACGFSVHAGSGWRGLPSNADKAAGVSGWLAPWDAAQTRNVGDLVGLYVATSAIIPVATVAANYTSTTATVSAASVNAGRLKRGMWLLTKHSPIRYTALLESWEVVGGSLILNTTGWRQFNTPNTGQANATPANGVELIVNASNAIWGINTNISLDVGDTTEHAVLGEMGIFNSKAVSLTYDDLDFYASGLDIANIGSKKATNLFIARGSSFTGYLASMNDVGFRAESWGSYSAPTIGFRYKGSGTAYEYYSPDGTQRLKIAGQAIEFGALGVAGTPAFDFHSSTEFNDYDVRLMASGGSAGDGNGFLTVSASAVLLPKTVPATNNAVSLGQSANRWTEVFATNGTINTSDPRLKRFRHDSNEMAALKRAVERIDICTFQWLDALEEKGEAARIHIGVSAQDVADAFEAEGLDARRYGLFCEDDEVDHVEVVEYVEVPDEETIDELVTLHEMDGDVAVLRQKTVQVRRPKMRTVPLLNEDKTPVMVERGVVEDGKQVFNGDGHPVKELVAATIDVPVMRLQEVKRIESRPTGRKIMSLRYDQLAMLMIAALRAE